MKDKEIEIQKICGFYVNDWHFTTMILPYVRKEIEGNKKVITFFQESIQSNIEEMLSKMNLNKTFEEKILKINWNKANSLTQKEIKQTLELIEKGTQTTQTISILVKGDNEFIETINEKIETASSTQLKSKVKIINFYDLSKNDKVDFIIAKHQCVINTMGIQNISKSKKKEKEA